MAMEAGFTLVGVTAALPHSDLSFYDAWLKKGYAGEMGYLSTGRDRRADPRIILPSAKTILCLGLNYYRGQPKSLEGLDTDAAWISRYAWGDDYHDIFKERMNVLEKKILERCPDAQIKSYCDTGAILERSYAASAGLGWVGKNTCLINQKTGSYFFIGELITSLDLEIDSPASNHCGTCNRCVEVCPTQALTPYEMDSNKCIAYLTIEYRGGISEEMQRKISPHVYGCDLCQEVCPWNKKPPLSLEQRFDPRDGLLAPKLEDLAKISEEDFSQKFKKSPIKRTKWKGLQRNIEWNKNARK